MKLGKRISLVLLLSFSACQTVITPTATIKQISTATITPSATQTRTPTLTLTPDPFAIAERIQYDVNNDIWVYVKGTIESVKAKSFVFSGMKGQEIRLYLQYDPYYSGGWIDETKIFDENGNLIKSDRVPDSGGWEGTLPSTQDYIIYSIPVDNSKTEFVLQFVNIPPRKESGYFTHKDTQNGFEVTYSQDDFKPSVNEDLSDVFSVTIDAERYFKDTILQLSDVVISIGPHSPDVECPVSLSLSERYYSTKEIINGISFEKFDLHDAATGTEAELLFFITAHNDRCYTIFVKTLYIRVDKFPNTGLKDFSRSILYTKIYRLLNTFEFTK